MKKLEWHNETRLISDLIPYDKNPRRLTDKQKKDLTASLKKFNLVEVPAIDTDNIIISGHQRLKILSELNELKEIDVRVPNRKLTEKEFEEYNIRANKNTGEFDFEILDEFFEKDELIEWGFVDEEFDFKLTDDLTDGFSLPDGDKAPFQQMTFTLADEQAIQIQNAISDIKTTEEYKFVETMGNENSNGNALYLIIMQWAEQRK